MPSGGLGPGAGQVHAEVQAEELGMEMIHDLPSIIHRPPMGGERIVGIVEAPWLIRTRHELPAGGGAQQANGAQGIETIGILQENSQGIGGRQAARPRGGAHGLGDLGDVRRCIARRRQHRRGGGGRTFSAEGPLRAFLGHEDQVVDESGGPGEFAIGAGLGRQTHRPGPHAQEVVEIVGQLTGRQMRGDQGQ